MKNSAPQDNMPGGRQSEEPVRLFIGIAPDKNTQRFLDGICAAREQQGMPRKFRWTSHTNRHLTLAFLGDTDPAHLDTIEIRLKDIAQHTAPLDGRIVSTHPFPKARARLFAAELLPSQRLLELHQACQALMRAIGKAPEKKTFRPHFTLARSPGGFCSLLPVPTDFICHLNNITLYHSLLAPGGSQYQPLLTLPLTGAHAPGDAN
ncbi:RNA 2',3'-cyclic phosphodiesterase [Microbulbifer agarilyticus]|uniref:RNA 2',3'-cyclic phosphodiesterase n=1 Tax=Microbulbifer agarilyticus TaxID=260552 RepID=UPI001C96D2B7|nr:RNA 2',3'-cyclic phosphodiesterase [Microbulbifer agarilyticus]MBY6212150.1 RNA 2',3'-cyclic phosphodiesterase [Microbulbifer agarilyticus]